MNRFNSTPGLPVDPISLSHEPSHQYHSRRATTSPSSTSSGPRFGNTPHDESYSNTDHWSDSSSSSPEAMMPYQHPWVIEPSLNYNTFIPSLSTMEHTPDGLPRMMTSFGNDPPDWPSSVVASNYSTPNRQSNFELRRLNECKGASDWAHAPDSKSESFYIPSQTIGSHTPPFEPSFCRTTTSTSPASITITATTTPTSSPSSSSSSSSSSPSSCSSYSSPSPRSSSLSSSSSSLSSVTTTAAGTATNPIANLMSSSSPPTNAPYQSLHVRKLSAPVKLDVDREDLRLNMDETEESSADPPYSLLIYQALRSAPGMKLPLQGIYGWFEKNTAKGKDRNSKGWQNSIRHNLSMNAGFEAVREESTPGKKAVNFWRLTDEAVNNGIQSTTRYRKQANYKKSIASEPPAPQRQRSGAKGGKATKVTARFRGSTSQDELRKERYRQRIIPSQRHIPKNIYGQYLQAATITVPSSLHVPGPTIPMTRSLTEPFDLSNVVGCADPPPCAPMLCDMAGPGSDCLALDTGFMGWDGIHSFSHGLLTGPEISTELQLGL